MRRAWISLGGGVQSVTLCVLAVMRHPELLAVTDGVLPEGTIFADTQREKRATYGYLAWLLEPWLREVHNFPMIVATNGNIRDDYRRARADGRRWDNFNCFTAGREYGTRGRLFKGCSKFYKAQVVNRVMRDLLGPTWRTCKEPIAEKWLGISYDEWQRVKDCDVPWAIRRDPLVDMRWTRRRCEEYLDSVGIPPPPKSACIECPERGDKGWALMKRDSPEEFEEACVADEEIRGGFMHAMPSPSGECFLHASLKPLRTVKFESDTPDLAFCDEGGCFT